MKKNTVVYLHKRKDTGEIFYVGIGSKKRPYAKDNRNKYWFNIVNKHGYTVEIIKTELTWDDACKEEIRLIKLYGRKDLGLGSLVNMSDGGEGNKNLSKESRKKISDKMLGNIPWNKGKEHSEETKRKIGLKSIGRYFSEDTRKNMSKKRKGEKNRNSKLNKTQVIEIRNYYEESERTIKVQKHLSNIYGVSVATIQKIVYNKNWTHI